MSQLSDSTSTNTAVQPVVARLIELPHKNRELPEITLSGQTIHALTEAHTNDHILKSLENGTGGWVITVNIDHLRRLRSDEKLRDIYRNGSLIVADGTPLIWAARVQGTPLPERVAGSNLISSLSAAAATRNHSVFLLGGDEGTAESAAQVLRERYPGLRIAGTDCPAVGFENDAKYMAGLIDRLAQADADIVFVALGSPKQEYLIARIQQCLPRAWWLGIGISFSFLCGRVRRAPVWMQKLGLEWVHRLWQEPRRLARRYLIDGLPFALRLFCGAAVARLRRHRGPA